MFQHHDHSARKACEGLHNDNVSLIRRVDVFKTDQCGSVGPLCLGKDPKGIEEWLKRLELVRAPCRLSYGSYIIKIGRY